MSTQPLNPWVSIGIASVPQLLALFTAIAQLKKAYPSLTPEQIVALVSDITLANDDAFDDVLAKSAPDPPPSV